MTRDLRILHIIGGLQSGGAEALLYRLATRPSHFHHEIIALAGPDWYTPLLEQQGITVHHLNIRSMPSVARALPKLNRLIGRSRADVVQGWMYNSNLLAGLLARPRGIPVVWGIHSSTLEGTGLASRMAARLGGHWAAKLTDFVINCSTRSAGIHSDLGYARVKGAVIHNGYDPAAFFPDEQLRNSTRRKLSIADGTVLIGTIGRWSEQKDHGNLISALAIARNAGASFRCLLVGRGLDERNIELVNALSRVGCRDLVLLLGERADIPDLARAMDLHVLPSRVEAFPNAVPETMLSATPNVVTDVGDTRNMVGETGWVVEPRNPEMLAAAIGVAIEECTSDRGRWEQRRLAARQRIADRFTLDAMAAAYEDVWRRAADGTLDSLAATGG
jgi:glycosyltransferase involved in cell wall biosynthesis